MKKREKGILENADSICYNASRQKTMKVSV